jgi:3'(2'), 5'-bisphosphate nucleotidase
MLKQLTDFVKEAAKAAMEIYEKDFSVSYKDDKSPLTEADTKVNEIICNTLKNLYPQIPILSEENKTIDYEIRKNWKRYWCIDPIDGTKEFIKKNGEWTINIALIENSKPVLGVVYAPAIGDLYYAKKGEGAFKETIDDRQKSIEKERLPIKQDRKELVVVASKSHLSKETEEFIQKLMTIDSNLVTKSKGSSLKLCMVAEGSADIYPRLAPTMEWDTAAADAIVREAGKMTYIYDENFPIESIDSISSIDSMKYNKENLLNPWFVVV